MSARFSRNQRKTDGHRTPSQFTESEHESELSLEDAAPNLLRELTQRNCRSRSEIRVDRQIRHTLIVLVRGLGVVQHVKRVDAKLQTFRFRHLERLCEVRIESPDGETLNDVLTQIPPLSRLGVLENDLPIL
jgi:hypothetical protein